MMCTWSFLSPRWIQQERILSVHSLKQSMWWDTNIHKHNIIIIYSADPELIQVTKECGVSHRYTKYMELVCYKNI
jgi:hypothetical protein